MQDQTIAVKQHFKYRINNSLSHYLVKSKYSKVLQRALDQQNYRMLFFLSSKRGVLTPNNPLGAPLVKNNNRFTKLS